MGITDGSVSCTLCGEWLTGCSLCSNIPLDRRTTSRDISKLYRDEVAGEHETYLQSKSIRDGAERRKGIL